MSSLLIYFIFSPGADFHGVTLFGVVTNKQVAEVISLRDDESVYLSRRLNSSLVSQRFMKEGLRIQMNLDLLKFLPARAMSYHSAELRCFGSCRFSLEANATLLQNPSATGCLNTTKTSCSGCSLREQSPASWSGS